VGMIPKLLTLYHGGFLFFVNFEVEGWNYDSLSVYIDQIVKIQT
jgi:hypothetical protein